MELRSMVNARSIVVVCSAMCGALSAQVTPKADLQAPKRFEVVSLKPYGPRRGLGTTRIEDPRHIIFSPIVPFNLLLRAYEVQWYQVVAPRWMKETRYTFDATLPDGASKADIPAMLQQVLAERFRLNVHRESRVTLVYALTVGESGVHAPVCEVGKCPPNRSYSTPSTIRIQADTTSLLAEYLSGASDRPVVDKTNLSEHFSIAIEGTLPGIIPPAENTLPTVVSVLRKLGFKLEPRRQSIELLVVDGGSPVPTEN
jgi:uncharacterized protein (TIGR03435 family)